VAPGDPMLAEIEARLVGRPHITVPTITLQGAVDGVNSVESSAGHARYFTGPYERRVLPDVGHLLPHEAPDAHVRAVREAPSTCWSVAATMHAIRPGTLTPMPEQPRR
jgi:pimeloyl-ACP methyl ester carboxylesterase